MNVVLLIAFNVDIMHHVKEHMSYSQCVVMMDHWMSRKLVESIY